MVFYPVYKKEKKIFGYNLLNKYGSIDIVKEDNIKDLLFLEYENRYNNNIINSNNSNINVNHEISSYNTHIIKKMIF